MVMVTPCAGGGMLTIVAMDSCCAGDAGSGALGCAYSPGSAIVLVGSATSGVSVACP